MGWPLELERGPPLTEISIKIWAAAISPCFQQNVAEEMGSLMGEQTLVSSHFEILFYIFLGVIQYMTTGKTGKKIVHTDGTIFA
jgi:hypothetical protein